MANKVTKTATGVAKNAHGKSIAEYGLKDASGALIRKIGYKFDWLIYPDEQSMLDANDGMSLKEQLKARNAASKTTARQAANAAAILAAGINAPNSENDSQFRLTQVFDGLYGKYRASGMNEDDARTKARAKAAEMLEEDWEDDDEDE